LHLRFSLFDPWLESIQSVDGVLVYVYLIGQESYPFLEHFVNAVNLAFKLFKSLIDMRDLSNSCVDFGGVEFKLRIDFLFELIEVVQ
jgi:hypothetical protein